MKKKESLKLSPPNLLYFFHLPLPFQSPPLPSKLTNKALGVRRERDERALEERGEKET
jgi:hypothetical protein